MKSDIILAGVGGQGILSIAAAIGLAALKENLQIRQAEVHGMSQRGGAVQSHLRISSGDIASDLIPLGKADMILSVEPMESLRYLPYLSPDGWLITSNVPFININNYPPVDNLIEEVRRVRNHVEMNADELARQAGSVRSSNMVVLGAASVYLPVSVKSFEAAIRDMFSRKGEELVNINTKAFQSGRNYTMSKNT